MFMSGPMGEGSWSRNRPAGELQRDGDAVPEMSVNTLRRMIDVWALETASAQLDDKTEIEDRFQRRYFRTHGASVLHAYAIMELSRQERVIAANDTWVALVPFWANSPFETMVLPRRRVSRLNGLTETERDGLVDLLIRLKMGYDTLFGGSLPYVFEWHGAPGRSARARHWQLHAHFRPPYLRPSSVHGQSSGFSKLEDADRSLTPEAAAACLKEAVA